MNAGPPDPGDTPLAGPTDFSAPLEDLAVALAALQKHAQRLNDHESAEDLQLIGKSADGIGRLISEELAGAVATVGADPANLRRVRHEIRNGLNQIIGLSELIAESELLGSDDEAASELEQFLRTGNGLLQLLQERLADPVPRAEPEAAGDPEQAAESRLVEPADILVIDDDETNRETLGRWVEQLGHRVYQADGGGVGLEMVADGHYDLILLDLLMPDMDGYEFLEAIKQDDASA